MYMYVADLILVISSEWPCVMEHAQNESKWWILYWELLNRPPILILHKYFQLYNTLNVIYLYVPVGSSSLLSLTTSPSFYTKRERGSYTES